MKIWPQAWSQLFPLICYICKIWDLVMDDFGYHLTNQVTSGYPIWKDTKINTPIINPNLTKSRNKPKSWRFTRLIRMVHILSKWAEKRLSYPSYLLSLMEQTCLFVVKLFTVKTTTIIWVSLSYKWQYFAILFDISRTFIAYQETYNDET